jgi:hypothetical protein
MEQTAFIEILERVDTCSDPGLSPRLSTPWALMNIRLYYSGKMALIMNSFEAQQRRFIKGQQQMIHIAIRLKSKQIHHCSRDAAS